MNDTPLTAAVKHALRHTLRDVLGAAFETRDAQVDMAVKVAAAIETGRIVVVEAETGLGKSLAYLVPLIFLCARTGARAVVTTYTKHLQRQLFEKDLVHALRSAPGAKGALTAAVLMGRSSYACRRAIESTLVADRRRGARPDVNTDHTLADWLRMALNSETGELETLPDASLYLDGELRRKIACPTREAACSGCRLRDDCFMFRARRKALDAQFVVTNHALLFSNVIASGSLLGPYDVLVVDEAHHLEDVATDFYSLSYSPHAIRGAHHSIYSPAFEETVKYIRTMTADESPEDAEAIGDLWTSFHEAIDTADKSTTEMFSVLGRNATAVVSAPGNSSAGRNAYEIKQALYQEGAPLLYGVDTPAADVSRALGRMEAAVEGILDIVDRHDSLSESGATGAMRAIRDSTTETHAEFDFLVAGSSDDHVFYAQLRGGPPSVGADTAVALAASPVDVSARLGTTLEDGSHAAVLTSATLAVDGDFTFTLQRLGLDRCPRADTLRYDSPFDLDECRAVLLAAHMPDPGDRSFVGEAADIIETASAACDRRVLVLCTARSQVTALERLLSNTRGSRDGEVFAQTDGASREDLMARFKRSRRGILVGLASFWEGIDLPVDALELLVILKLPFLVPSEPVTQARSKRIADSGDVAFEKLFIPDVVLKLRQGMGRLIRTGGDRGAVLILDRRLWHSRYGEGVLRAVTNKFVRCNEREHTIEYLKTFFGQS